MIPQELLSKRVLRQTTESDLAIPDTQVLQRTRARHREMILAEFGLLYTGRQICQTIRKTLPMRWFGAVRATRWYMVEKATPFRWNEGIPWGLTENSRSSEKDIYPRIIPDAALQRYAAAREAGYFDGFAVVEAVYHERRMVGPDPWLLGQFGEEFAVLAYWE